jgi:hypothetical protein
MLNATFAGTPPFAFQWLFDGIAVPGATNHSLILSNMQPENAGIYRLSVSNDFGSITSAGSVLNVLQYGNGGTIEFANFSFNRVFDVGGSNGVPIGAGYVAGLYAGSQADSLTVVGGPAAFVLSGRFLGGTRTMPLLSAGQTGYFQVRVWDSKVSATYEEAVALGAKSGASTIFQATVGGGITPPGQIIAMPSFALEAGTGVVGRHKIQSVTSVPTQLGGFSHSLNAVSFVLTGPAGATVAIEASPDLVNWTVIAYVVNNSGAVKFADPNATPSSIRFYRAKNVSP